MITDNNYQLEDMKDKDRIGNESTDDRFGRKNTGKRTYEQRLEAAREFDAAPAAAPRQAWYGGRRPNWRSHVSDLNSVCQTRRG